MSYELLYRMALDEALKSLLSGLLDHPHPLPLSLSESSEGYRCQQEQENHQTGPGKIKPQAKNFHADIQRHDHATQGEQCNTPHDKFCVAGPLEHRGADHIQSIK